MRRKILLAGLSLVVMTIIGLGYVATTGRLNHKPMSSSQDSLVTRDDPTRLYKNTVHRYSLEYPASWYIEELNHPPYEQNTHFQYGGHYLEIWYSDPGLSTVRVQRQDILPVGHFSLLFNFFETRVTREPAAFSDLAGGPNHDLLGKHGIVTITFTINDMDAVKGMLKSFKFTD